MRPRREGEDRGCHVGFLGGWKCVSTGKGRGVVEEAIDIDWRSDRSEEVWRHRGGKRPMREGCSRRESAR